MATIGLCVASSAAAQPADESQASGRAAPELRRHFEQGMEHFRGRRFREALRAFELVAGRVPSAALWFDIARCHEQLGEDELAIEHYGRYLRDAVDAPDRREIEARIARLRERQAALRASQRRASQGLLRVDTSVDGALLLVADEPVGYTPVERLLELPPGRHLVTLSHPQHEPFRGAVVVEQGSLTVARADLRPLPRRERVASSRTWTWLLGAGAVAALAAGAVAAIASHDARDGGDRSRADDLRTSSDVAFAVGLSIGLASVVAYFGEGVTPERSPPASRAASTP